MTNFHNKQEHEAIHERVKLALLGYHAGIYEWNMLDNSAYYSDEWKDMLGYKSDEIAPQLTSWANLVHPDDIDAIMQNVQKTVKQQKKDIETVHRLRHKDGNYLWILGRGFIEYAKDGSPKKMVGIHTDVTNRKEQELKLQRLAQMVEQTHDSVISTDLKGNILTWNKGSELLFGYKEDEVLHRNILLLQNEEDSIDFSTITKDLQTNNELHFETRFRAKNGELIYVDLSLSTYKDEENNLIGLIGYSQDITQRKYMEEKLENHNHNLQQYLHSIDEINVGLFVVNEDYTVEYMNNTMKRWFGEQIGGTCYSSITNLKEPCTYCKIHDVIKDDDKVTYEPITKDGRQFHIVAKSIINPDGSRSKMEIIRDITEEVKAKEVLLQEKSELKYKANHDFLTHLPNRALFEDRLERTIVKAKRDDTKIALFFIDLDHFKEINDSLGHDTGDIVLKEVGNRILHTLREEDTLARLGGDEFAVIIEDLKNLDNATMLAKKIIKALQKPIDIQTQEVSISASIGISIYPEDANSASKLVKDADIAMYRVKQEGRDGYMYYGALGEI